jgi:N-methylhydantoinase B
MFTQWALRPDSAGAGVHRGGFGAVYELELLGGGDVALLGERGKQAPFGVLGGEPAALNRFFWQTEDGEKSPPMASKITDLRLPAGKRIRLETPGGGGWGDPHRRDPEKVLHDVKLGLVSVAQAKALYGVVIGTDGEIDMQATGNLRNGVAA